jgi:hypothetical protein
MKKKGYLSKITAVFVILFVVGDSSMAMDGASKARVYDIAIAWRKGDKTWLNRIFELSIDQLADHIICNHLGLNLAAFYSVKYKSVRSVFVLPDDFLSKHPKIKERMELVKKASVQLWKNKWYKKKEKDPSEKMPGSLEVQKADNSGAKSIDLKSLVIDTEKTGKELSEERSKKLGEEEYKQLKEFIKERLTGLFKDAPELFQFSQKPEMSVCTQKRDSRTGIIFDIKPSSLGFKNFLAPPQDSGHPTDEVPETRKSTQKIFLAFNVVKGLDIPTCYPIDEGDVKTIDEIGTAIWLHENADEKEIIMSATDESVPKRSSNFIESDGFWFSIFE